ncbi:hemoglobin [Panacibacter ginsenosidivorans]|uniref:Hemoglobin n=1 Tax=Panacibacter ginsenosidivorans TaxID=1813871 RepID=A0A5B8VBW2_9BACT|nr:globin domain-containing protein [Panacibacter ginsenosidivorans]QEC68421.1 hemoglobin [Panacibacter ginsenosidivorans]
MTEEQVILVKQSWKSFYNVDAHILGDLFYSKLFFDNPRLRKMFPESMEAQHYKLINMLTAIVRRIDDPDALAEDIKNMSMRHTGYGVKPDHYRLVGNALLWTLEKGLGNSWNEKVKDAWRAFYEMIAAMMISAGRAQMA